MAKSKYDPETFPLLVEGYARDGYSDKQMYQKLEICADTFYNYIKKYPEFSKSLKKGRGPVNTEVENALLSVCMGYEYEEETRKIVEIPVITVVRTVNANGMVIKTEKQTTKDRRVEVSKTKKFVPPNANACKHWLRHKKPEIWGKIEKEEEGFSTIADMMLEFTSKEEDENNVK